VGLRQNSDARFSTQARGLTLVSETICPIEKSADNAGIELPLRLDKIG
jgi:hypothetical protein